MTGHKQSLTQRTQSSQSNAKPPRVKLGDVCHQVRGVSYKPRDAREEFAEGYVPLLRANNIGDGLNHDGLVYVDCKCVSRHQYVRKGDLLVCASSGSRHLVGKAALVDFDGNETFGAFCKVVRPNPLFVNSGYMAQYFQSDAYRITIANKAAGANINNIRSEHLDNLEIPLPPLPEQKRIAVVLDKICEMKRNVEARLQKLDLLVKSRFVEMFGGEIWPKTTIGELSEFLTSGSRGWAKYYSDKGELFITIKNVKNSRITVDDVQHIVPPQGAEADRTRVREGDLLISITADLGRTGVVTDEIASRGAYINQHLTRISLRRDVVDPLYAAFYIESPEGKAQIERRNQSAVKAGLNFESIRSIQLPLPPLALQREFAAFVAEVDKSKFVLRETLSRMETLYRAKLQEYFG